MFEPTTYQRVYREVALLEYEAVEQWRQTFHPDLDREQAHARHVRSVETTVVRRHGGNISVTIAIVADRFMHCTMDYFDLQIAGNRIQRKPTRTFT